MQQLLDVTLINCTERKPPYCPPLCPRAKNSKSALIERPFMFSHTSVYSYTETEPQVSSHWEIS